MMEKQKKSKLWILVGVPGAGKSYWIANNKKYFQGSTKIVSRDAIRFSLINDDDEYFSKEKEVFRLFTDQIRIGLATYDNTVADATHLNPASRGKLLHALSDSLKDVEVNAIVIESDLARCLEQNSWRNDRKRVPESALVRMFKSYSAPTLAENFDSIYFYTRTKAGVTYRIFKRSDDNGSDMVNV